VAQLLPHSLPLAWEGMALFGTLRNAVANRKMSATSRAGTVGSYGCFSIVGQTCRESNAPDGSFSQVDTLLYPHKALQNQRKRPFPDSEPLKTSLDQRARFLITLRTTLD
jgi:hypothetical protein